MHNLRQFLDLLRREGELVTVDAPVPLISKSPKSTAASLPPPVRPCSSPTSKAQTSLRHHLFGTARRVDLAFGPRPEQFIQQLVQLAQDLPSLSRASSGRTKPDPRRAQGWAKDRRQRPRRRVRAVAAQSRTSTPTQNLARRRRTLHNLPLVYTEHPDTGHHNSACTASSATIPRPLASTGKSKKAAAPLPRRRAADEDLPLVILVGGPPALILAAIAPLPEDLPS